MKVELTVRQIGHIRAALEIVIAEHGRGMSKQEKEELEHLLDRFWIMELKGYDDRGTK